MNFKPENQIIFSYKSGKHLQTILILTNTSSSPNIFKFKASNPHRISIKPSPGLIKPNEEMKVLVMAHRDIIDNIQNEQIQITYGPKEYTQTHNFGFVLENGSKKDQLNLTMMVNQKQSRVKHLEEEMMNYKSIPKVSLAPKPKKKSSGVVKLAVAGVVGLALGYLSPFALFG